MPGAGRQIGGGLVNSIAAGAPVYNKYTGQYAPKHVTGMRTALGVLGQVGGPAGGLIGMLGNALYTRNNPQAQAWDAGVRGWKGIMNQFSQNQEGMADYLQSQRPEVGGYSPQIGLGRPQLATGGVQSVPTMQPVEAQGSWSGLGTSSGGLFSGGQLGNWANGNAQPQGHNFGQAAGSFTPWGAGVVQNDHWGTAAGGFGIGVTNSGSGGSFALADAMAANKKNRD